MILRVRRLLVAGAMGSVFLMAAGSTLGPAVAAPGPADDAALPVAVETFNYPNAAKILKEQGIALRKGDGHILLADCKVSKDIVVSTGMRHPGQTESGKYCFRVTGTGKVGYLSLEIPKVFNVRAGDYSVRASVTADGKTETVTVPKNEYTPVGVGIDDQNTPTMLVELRVTG
ncbi:hypothetical protein SNS2_1350 [Streptomyces netropsis]|nr:hypothetical protein SNS2_1350 [Streptomyces netropsis]